MNTFLRYLLADWVQHYHAAAARDRTERICKRNIQVQKVATPHNVSENSHRNTEKVRGSLAKP
jgi:hypothetical protein